MIKKDELKPAQNGVKIKGGAGITYEDIQSWIKTKADEYGIPVAFQRDTIRSGGLFNKKEEPCLVLFHPQHPTDYFRRCITFRVQGIFAYVEINYYGSSVLTGQQRTREERRNSDSVATNILGLLTRVDNAAYDSEYDYYDALNSVIEEALMGA